jgi:hypothetical protein
MRSGLVKKIAAEAAPTGKSDAARVKITVEAVS